MASATVIGGGPAGLMAAEVLAEAGVAVTVRERMPTVGRKFLIAGRGGLNLTHSEPFEAFVARYAEAAPKLRPVLEAFPPSALVAWAEGLGQAMFVGSSGRVFPRAMKASPLLRAWLLRLAQRGVAIRTRRLWTGWDKAGRLTFETEDGGVEQVTPDAAVLALGGASWPRLGSDGRWTDLLRTKGVGVSPLRPANSGFDVAWTPLFRDRFAGSPLKTLTLRFEGRRVRGEAVLTATGIEGGAVYALSAVLREAVMREGRAVLHLDLRPDLDEDAVVRRLAATRAGASTSERLRRALGLPPVVTGLLREAHGVSLPADPSDLARAVKDTPLTLTGVASLDRAISTAGGVRLGDVGDDLQLRALPGVFVAGEMLDWEAPTGGYLLQASFATGVAAAHGVLRRLASTARPGQGPPP